MVECTPPVRLFGRFSCAGKGLTLTVMMKNVSARAMQCPERHRRMHVTVNVGRKALADKFAPKTIAEPESLSSAVSSPWHDANKREHTNEL